MNTMHMDTSAELTCDQPMARPVEGHPIGNGRMGTLVWTTPGTVEFQINRVDVFAVNRKQTACTSSPWTAQRASASDRRWAKCGPARNGSPPTPMLTRAARSKPSRSNRAGARNVAFAIPGIPRAG